MTSRVWFQLVDTKGDPYEGTNLDSITERPSLIVDLCDKIYEKCKNALPLDCVGSMLRVFETRADAIGNTKSLASETPIKKLGVSSESCLYVAVPDSVKKQRIVPKVQGANYPLIGSYEDPGAWEKEKVYYTIPDPIVQRVSPASRSESSGAENAVLKRLEKVESTIGLNHISKPDESLDYPLIASFDHPGAWQKEEVYYTIPDQISNRVFPASARGLILYRREAVRDFFGRLNSQGRYTAVVGPPGIGKSVNAFAYALGLVRATERRVVWIQPDVQVMVFIGTQKLDIRYMATKYNSNISHLLESKQITDIFFDQYRQDYHYDFLPEYLKWVQGGIDDDSVEQDFSPVGEDEEIDSQRLPTCPRRLILISSDGFQSKYAPFDLRNTINLAPWSRKDYKMVLKNEQAKQAFIRRNKALKLGNLSELISRKFFYAGISARFFFDKTVSEIRAEINNAMECVESWDSLWKADSGIKSKHAVNRLCYKLRTHERSVSLFTSEYITQRIALLVGPHLFVQALEKFGSRPNRGLVGGHFEGYVVACFCKGTLKYWREPDCWLRYQADIPLGSLPDQVHWYEEFDLVEPGRWYRPANPYQGGFDLFRVDHDQQSMRREYLFLQITCGKSHSWNPSHFSRAVTEMNRHVMGNLVANECEVHIVFVVPEGMLGIGVEIKLSKGSRFRELRCYDGKWKRSSYKDHIMMFGVPQSDIFLATTS